MKMIKKCIALLCLLTVIFLPFQSMAAGTIDTSKNCTLTMSFPVDEEAAQGVAFSLYRVADISSDAEFSVAEKFSAYPIASEMFSNAENWRNLAQTLFGYVVSDDIKADYTTKTDMNAVVVFRDIPVGLYLVTGAEYVTDKKIYIPQSFMISAPNSDINDAWNYDISIDVKYDSRLTDEDFDLEVLKIWNDSKTANRPFDIAVEIYKNRELYDTIILSKDNNWKFEMKHLNADAIWTVKEKTVAEGYTVSVDRQNDRFVLTNTEKRKNPPKTDIPSDPKLPQTGLLWWPVPYLLIGGLLMILIGVICRRGAANES